MATNKLIRLIRDVNHLSFCNVLKDPFLKPKNNSKYLRNLPYSNGLLKRWYRKHNFTKLRWTPLGDWWHNGSHTCLLMIIYKANDDEALYRTMQLRGVLFSYLAPPAQFSAAYEEEQTTPRLLACLTYRYQSKHSHLITPINPTIPERCKDLLLYHVKFHPTIIILLPYCMFSMLCHNI